MNNGGGEMVKGRWGKPMMKRWFREKLRGWDFFIADISIFNHILEFGLTHPCGVGMWMWMWMAIWVLLWLGI